MAQTACAERTAAPCTPAVRPAAPRTPASAEAAFQRDVSTYWNHRAETYSNAVLQELAGDAHTLWRSYLQGQIPQTAMRAPRVLDLGCGPGFFDIVFAEAGCEVVAVDSSEGMLARAYANIASIGLEDRVCLHMGNAAHLPELAAGSFDLVISRNVTWLMRDLRAAYAEWLRLLRPGGILLAFDSNWYHYLNDDALAASRALDERAIKDEVPADRLATAAQERRCEMIAAQIPTTYLSRPGFDERALKELGASAVTADPEIWKTLWTPDEQRYYRTSPMFMVRAVK